MNAKVLFAALLATSIVQAAESPQPLVSLPAGWSLMGNGGPQALPGSCELGIDSQKSTDGKPLYSVLCTNNVLPSFGGARTAFDVARYRGKRVRVSGWLKASGIESVASARYPGVAGEAGLWIGVGTPGTGLGADRMPSRTISGSTEWVNRDFVADIPADANQLMAGFWMQGKGQVWVRDLMVEEVPTTVAVSFLRNDQQRAAAPDMSLVTAISAAANERFLPPPQRWLAVGAQGFELCDIGIDASLLKLGQRNLSIACGVPQGPLLRQSFEAAPYWGKRIRFSGWIKTENVELPAPLDGTGGAGLFLSLSGNQGPALHSNLRGTADWQYRELVLEVPRNSQWILVGLAMSGTGQVWGRDFKFEEVASDIPVSR